MGISVDSDGEDSAWVSLNSLPNIEYQESVFMAAIHKEKEKDVQVSIGVKNEAVEMDWVTRLCPYILQILIYRYIYIYILYVHL